MSPMKFVPLLGRRLSRLALVPWMSCQLRRRMQRFEPTTVEAIGRSLQLDAAAARQVYRRSVRSFVQFNVDYVLMCRSTPQQLRLQAERVRLLGAQRLTPFLTPGRPVLIITIHMGNFQLGFLKLATSIRSQRDIFVFKMSAANELEHRMFGEFGQHLQRIAALRTGEEGGRKAFMELRRGNVVAMAVDLEVHVTSRASVDFFSRPCHMQSGPATLAAMSNAVILPVINYVDASGQPVIQVEEPLFAQPLTPAETLPQVVQRLTQRIAGLMESWIRIDPTQVHAWSSIAETMQCPVPEAGTVRQGASAA